MWLVLWIGCFGFFGAIARYMIERSFLLFTSHIPIATFAINVLGSFLIGILYAASVERDLLGPTLGTALAVGFLGGFTTFSGYSIQTLLLIEQKHLTASAIYFAASPLSGLLMARLGLSFGRTLFG
ncbi:MAG: CrcB family protein [Bdellovibrionales bacterium]